MKKADFETRFNAFFAAGATPDMGEVAKFREEALKDYDDFSTASTTLSTVQQKVTDLEKVNADLHATNYKLFLMNPAVFTKPDPKDPNQQQTGGDNGKKPEGDSGHVEGLADIQAGLFATDTNNS